MSLADLRWSWESFQEQVDPEILAAPNIAWDAMDLRIRRYLLKSMAGTPWFNHVALLAGVLLSHAQLDLNTTKQYIGTLHARWKTLFPAYGLTSVGQWNPSVHLPRYLRDEQFPHSLTVRETFLRNYRAACVYSQSYLRTLLPNEQAIYRKWASPEVPSEVTREMSRGTELIDLQHAKRKVVTDALAPHYSQLRAQAYHRWNALNRLHKKFQEVVQLAEKTHASLPLSFSYEEPSLRQKLHFRLWDSTSFRLARWRQDRTDGVLAPLPAQPFFFLEWVASESMNENGLEPEQMDLMWFSDLIRHGLLRNGLIDPTSEEGKRQRAYLDSWGYRDEEKTRDSNQSPFYSGILGLLSWPRPQASFLRYAQRRVQGLVLLVEPLYAAATVGLAALDVFTTTGARMAELLQVSLTPECLQTLTVQGSRRHLFSARPYLFQYSGNHLSGKAVTACLRFLCHGLVYQTIDGQTVILKAHALRHVFATHLHQVEHVPLDVLAVLMHQRNLQVTGYYAAPTQQQVREAADSLIDRFACDLGSLDEAIVRAPEDLQRQLVEARENVGTLTCVPGGDCTCHAVCPWAFSCTGCIYKVPNPERRQDIVEQKRWAGVWLKRAEARQLGPEITKMRVLRQRCDIELEEMRLIEAYRKDEKYEPPLQVESDI